MSCVFPTVIISADEAARRAALALRADLFRAGRSDADPFDAAASHGLIHAADGEIAGCFRISTYPNDHSAQSGYSGQFYDLSPLGAQSGPVVELGRFAFRPDKVDTDLLRRSFAAIADYVVAQGATALFGCTSFRGVDPAPFAHAFALIARDHLLPEGTSPTVRGGQTLPLTNHGFDRATALRTLPPLLRSYLKLGGKVGRQAVIDPDLGTIHVYTRLQAADVSDARKRSLLVAS